MSQATLGRLDWTLSPRARTRIRSRPVAYGGRERERGRRKGARASTERHTYLRVNSTCEVLDGRRAWVDGTRYLRMCATEKRHMVSR